MATVTQPQTPMKISYSAAAFATLLVMAVAAIATTVQDDNIDRLVPQQSNLEFNVETSPTGLSFQTP